MSYYKQIAIRYMLADADMRKQSRDHWMECHKRNVLSKREDLIIFSAQILAAYDLVDAEYPV